MNNPYDRLYEMMINTAKAQVPQGYRIGIVISEKEDTIKKVSVGKMEYQSGENELMIIGSFDFDKGDELLLIPFDSNQQMLIIGKVNRI
ncbi:MAG: hypothetical protein LKJ25_01045 [Clostridia bacterium]|jgi:hypothetical protein|nr:hypothetical protein [Clostridia bacterium]